MTTMGSLLRFELAGARRAKTVSMFAIGFSLATIVVALVGLSSGGSLAVQGFARTSMSLLQLVLWVVPLMGLLIGASVGAECLELELMAALPVSRAGLVIARWFAWVIVLGASITLGLGVAGLVISIAAGSSDAWRYLRLIGVSNLLLAVCVAMGMTVGILARTRIRAMATAVLVWVVLVIGIDLIAIGALAILPRGQAGIGLTALLMADPVDSARALGVALLQADLVAGPTGAALRKVLGGWGVWALLVAMIMWAAVPLYSAGRRFARMDL
jgi:Cu-processing system permease protein